MATLAEVALQAPAGAMTLGPLWAVAGLPTKPARDAEAAAAVALQADSKSEDAAA